MASLEHIDPDDSRRQSIIQWRASVQAALESNPAHDDDTCSTCDFYEQESVVSDASSASSSQIHDSKTPPARRASWRSKLSVPPIWPWLSRTSHSCGHAILLALVQSSSLAVEDSDYRDSINGKSYNVP